MFKDKFTEKQINALGKAGILGKTIPEIRANALAEEVADNFGLLGGTANNKPIKTIEGQEWLDQGELSPAELDKIYNNPYKSCPLDCPGYEICSFGGGKVCGGLPDDSYRFDPPHSLAQISTGIAMANNKLNIHYGPEIMGTNYRSEDITIHRQNRIKIIPLPKTS